jgi:hypothetical protein
VVSKGKVSPASRAPRRARSHDIDTEAKRALATALPSNWEARDLTGHDYGIDLLVELFEADEPRGQILQFQIKGQDVDWPVGHLVTFQFPVSTLLYAEFFAVPVVAAVVPVRGSTPMFAFLWLQEYIAVVLDPEHATWRSQETVALHFPEGNVFPGAKAHLEWIAGHLDRQRAISRLGWIAHELRWAADEVEFGINRFSKTPIELLAEAKRLVTSNGDIEHIDKVSSGVDAVTRGAITPETLSRAGYPQLAAMAGEFAPDDLRAVVASDVQQLAQSLSATVAQSSDVQLRRSMWEAEKQHWF